MADLSSSSQNLSVSGTSPSGALDDSVEDSCSICLEPFSTEDPAAATSCKHEYHLQCILEWSQRSKECPICWQFLVLKDPASQELLAAVEIERSLRSRRTWTPSAYFHHSHEDFENDHGAPYVNDYHFNERLMQHLAASARRAHYVSRRRRQRSSGLGPSQVLLFDNESNDMDVHQRQSTSSDNSQSSDSGLSGGSSPISSIPSITNDLHPSMVSSDAKGDGHFKPRAFFSRSSSDSPRRSSPSEFLSLSNSIKTKFSAASSRYKESISKGARGIKEKILARNNSVKELSKGFKNEMSSSIANVARMVERFDLTSKRSGASVPLSDCTIGTSNSSSKGKGVQGNMSISPSLVGNTAETAHDLSSDAPPCIPAVPCQMRQ